MLLTPTLIQEAIRKYGKPVEVETTVEFKEWEWSYLGPSVEKKRFHDLTLFIHPDEAKDRFVTIQKPYYSVLKDISWLFRAPSGGLRPGETIEECAYREALEETGLEIQLEQFVLICKARIVVEKHSTVPWQSLVFTASAIGGELEPQDTSEISNVAVHTVQEMQGPIRSALLQSGWGGFRYRVVLTDNTFQVLYSQPRGP
jgi:ADP-ribose pyrophosphatase YjhB (NUDIX family)